MDWLDFAAIIVSVIALAISIVQFFVERKRNRMEATINAFAELQKTVLNQPEFISIGVSAVLSKHKELPEGAFDKDWEAVSEYLARIEQFAVGVNTKVYSVKVLDRMAGSHILKQYYRFLPIIEYKRKKAKTNKRYIEFQTMAQSLKTYNPDIKPEWI